ncbi:MAG: OmpA family protein [Saprospiraceae bacterium]|uniref:OmpA family protein n=1 Tax=Candidatus Opimibacter skivensis TaxID=2982028 RepID=A0A9D7SU94_9BACT|nr:OmpA family protein [Candidatus Opimibacter skivensis]
MLTFQVAKGQKNQNSDELGIHFGNFFIAGDVDHPLFPGFAGGLHYRTAINNALSFRSELFYGITYGLDAKPTTDGIFQEPGVFEGYSVSQPWFYSYQTKLIRLNFQGLLELTNLEPDIKYKKFNLFVLGGLGFDSHGTWLNLKDANGEPYTDLLNKTSFQKDNDYNTSSGRRAIRKELKEIYDATYETPAFKKVGEFRLGDETNIALEASIGLGISYRVSSRFNISLEHEIILSKNDYLDGLRWRTQNDVTNGFDVGHYTSVRLAMNINKGQKKEPLYWVNPWDENQKIVDSLESRVSELEKEIMDTDKDGVIDAVDQQANSVSNCPVDSKGITLDSDRDGISDCYDKFPFGDKSDIESIVADYLKKREDNSKYGSKIHVSDTSEIYSRINEVNKKKIGLPFVFFNSDSYLVGQDQYPALANIASFLKESNIHCIMITGHADNRDGFEYNEKLGLLRAQEVIKILRDEFGISTTTFNVFSKGEIDPLIIHPKSEVYEFINRRVEFKVCE